MKNKKERIVIDKVRDEVGEDTGIENKQPPMMAPLKGPPAVDIKLFATICGVKWDQIAGFVRYAKDKKLGPMTIDNWRTSLHEFNNKGVV